MPCFGVHSHKYFGPPNKKKIWYYVCEHRYAHKIITCIMAWGNGNFRGGQIFSENQLLDQVVKIIISEVQLFFVTGSSS